MLTPTANDILFTKFFCKDHKEGCNETVAKKGMKLLRMKQLLREFLGETF
jgi:hypothetical protein